MTNADDTLLRLDGVFTNIGRYRILHGVSLAARRGRVTMLLGRNGAGKTTTLRTIMGLWKARLGKIIFDGQPITALDTPHIARLGIAYVPENMGIFGKLTVRENMLLATGRRGFDPQHLERALESFPALKMKWESPAGSLSGGQKQMLAIGRAIIERRRLLLIDEPSVGLSPLLVSQMITKIGELGERFDLTVLMAEQNFNQAVRIADRGYIIVHGEIVVAANVEELRGNDIVKRLYLGGSV